MFTIYGDFRRSILEMIHVGSSAIRSSIERNQPLIGLHGHIHEARSTCKIGETLCVNPGSEYGEGILRGALLELKNGKIKVSQSNWCSNRYCPNNHFNIRVPCHYRTRSPRIRFGGVTPRFLASFRTSSSSSQSTFRYSKICVSDIPSLRASPNECL